MKQRSIKNQHDEARDELVQAAINAWANWSVLVEHLPQGAAVQKMHERMAQLDAACSRLAQS